MKNQNNKLIVDKSYNSCAIPKRFHHRVNLKILVQFWIANLFSCMKFCLKNLFNVTIYLKIRCEWKQEPQSYFEYEKIQI